MPRIRWTFSPTDVIKYGIEGPQFFDTELILDLPSSVLEELEATTRRHAGLLLAEIWPPRDTSVKTLRAIMWLSLRLGGHGLDWGDFDPQVLRAEFEEVSSEGDDASPPAEAPDESSSPEE